MMRTVGEMLVKCEKLMQDHDGCYSQTRPTESPRQWLGTKSPTQKLAFISFKLVFK